MTAKMKAPIQIDLKIKITNGSQDGVVTIGMGHACFPTEQEFRDRIAKFADEEMPDGFRLMTKREWFNSLFGQCAEQDEDGETTYIDYAMPGGNDWDA